MTTPTAVARVTINTPRRRIDVALPEHVPVAELLPELLRHAGETLADEGEQHGGWLLRRATGEPVQPAASLHAQGVRDGEVLHLVAARAEWPELEYDDVVEAIAASVRTVGPGWHPTATKAAAACAAGVVLGAGLLALLAHATQWTVVAVGLSAAAVLVLAGVTAARAYGNPAAAAALATLAVPYALVGGAAVGAGSAPVWEGGAPALLTGGTAAGLAAVLGAVGTGAALRVFTAAVTASTLAAAGALVAFWLPGVRAAAVVSAFLACTVGTAPLLAIRFGKLPIPPVTLPVGTDALAADPLAAAASPGGSALDAVRQRPDVARVRVAVQRTDELLTGLLWGTGVASVASAVLLVHRGGTAAALLAGIAAAVLLLRSRLFVAVRQRVALLTAGLAHAGVLAVALAAHAGAALSPVLVAGAVLVALVVVAAGATYASRPPSPYLSRAADLLDVVLVVSVIPVACAVLGLYAKVRGLAS